MYTYIYIGLTRGEAAIYTHIYIYMCVFDYCLTCACLSNRSTSTTEAVARLMTVGAGARAGQRIERPTALPPAVPAIYK